MGIVAWAHTTILFTRGIVLHCGLPLPPNGEAQLGNVLVRPRTCGWRGIRIKRSIRVRPARSTEQFVHATAAASAACGACVRALLRAEFMLSTG